VNLPSADATNLTYDRKLVGKEVMFKASKSAECEVVRMDGTSHRRVGGKGGRSRCFMRVGARDSCPDPPLDLTLVFHPCLFLALTLTFRRKACVPSKTTWPSRPPSTLCSTPTPSSA
jgi:hypothetical protein